MSTFGLSERCRAGNGTTVRRAPADRAAAPVENEGVVPVPQVLWVGGTADPLEEQAERTAHRVLAILQRSAPAPDAPGRRAGCAGGPHAVEVGAAGGAIGPATSSAIQRLRGGGRPLATPVRRRMEDAFGTGFGDVRVHAGATARDLNQRVGARAFTVGHDVVLGAGEADPVTADEHRVLAHELAHVVQNRGGSDAGGSALRRLVGFEVELSVPTVRAASTTPVTKVPNGPDPDPKVGIFFGGGVGYGIKMGKLTTTQGDIDLKADHNAIQHAGGSLFEAITAAAPAATAGAAYTPLSNLEYATPALDELAGGANASFKNMADAIDTHTAGILAAPPDAAMVALPDCAGYRVGIPRPEINAWLAPIADKTGIKAAAVTLADAVGWSMYIQATAGILPTGLPAMYGSQEAELPAGDNGDMLAALKDAASTVTRLSASFAAQPFVATFNEATDGKLDANDLLALRGVAVMAASYAVGNALAQTRLIGGTDKNSVQLLNKLTHMGLVTEAMTTRLQKLKGLKDNPNVLALIKGMVAWIHAEPQTGSAHWAAAPYNAPAVRERIYGKEEGLTLPQATARLIRDFLTGTATAGETGPGTPLPHPDPTPAAAGAAAGQRGIPLETRWTLTRPAARGELWPVFKSILDQVRAANLTHLGPEARAAALRDV